MAASSIFIDLFTFLLVFSSLVSVISSQIPSTPVDDHNFPSAHHVLKRPFAEPRPPVANHHKPTPSSSQKKLNSETIPRSDYLTLIGTPGSDNAVIKPLSLRKPQQVDCKTPPPVVRKAEIAPAYVPAGYAQIEGTARNAEIAPAFEPASYGPIEGPAPAPSDYEEFVC